MAKVVYVNVTTGSDSNSGLSPALAKATLAGASGARSVTVSGDRVSIATGVYLEPDVTWSSANDDDVVYMADGTGPVIVDFSNRPTAGQHWLISRRVTFISVWFRNPGTSTSCLTSPTATIPVWTINCVLYQKDGAANSGFGTTRLNVENCSYFNLNLAYISGGAGNFLFNTYFKTCTTPVTGTVIRDNNAFPGNTETGGINSSLTDPGFEDSASEDFRLDPITSPAAYQAYLTSGKWGGRIGATGTVGVFYDSRYPQTRMFSASPTPPAWPVWENDPTYVADGVLGTVIQDPATNDLTFDLITTFTATDGRIRSEVFDAGVGKVARFGSAVVGKFEDRPRGSALDINTTLPTTWEYRSSNTAFAKGDLTPAWVSIEQDDYVNVARRYTQVRITFRRDHTNS